MFDLATSIVIGLIGFVLGFVIKEKTKVDLFALVKLFILVAFLLPATFALFPIISNPTTDVVTAYINNLISNWVYLVVDIPALIAGAGFSNYVKPILENLLRPN